jgi:hypothetical protein
MDGDSTVNRSACELDGKSQPDAGYNEEIPDYYNEGLLDGYNECQEPVCRSLEFLELGYNEDHEEFL